MKIAAVSTIAGTITLTLGAAPLALAQYPSTAPSPAIMTSSPMMATGQSGNMSSNPMMAGNMATSPTSTKQGNAVNLSKSQIKNIQQALVELGYHLQVDGIWGQGTQDDIMDLQEKNGLNVTGRPDADTMRALGLENNQGLMGTDLSDRHTTTTITPSSGTASMQYGSMMQGTSSSSMHSGSMTSSSMMSNRSSAMMNNKIEKLRQLTPEQIREVQTALSEHSYATVDTTGKWDKTTSSALMKFQKTNGLPVTGYPDKKTRQLLGLDW